jgi:uncharacterized protein YciI
VAIDLQEFQLILLRRPAAAPDYNDETTERIQREHLAFYASLRAAGQVVTNGPVLEQPDEALRGISIFTMESVAAAAGLASTDPAVRAGRLEVEAMSWLCPPGTMATGGRPVRLED